MASIRKIEGKKGISYKVEVSNGYDVNGKKIRETTTFVPDHDEETAGKSCAEVRGRVRGKGEKRESYRGR